MNKEHLKELVKAHFNLVDRTPVTAEKFGELYDENKAFKIVFPGDTLKVGDEVKVVTTDGQESLAPDGYHKLEDGTEIKTEGSSVVEIVNPVTEAKEEEMTDYATLETGGSLDAVKKEAEGAKAVGFAGPKESISNVEGTTAQNATTDVNGALKAMGETVAEIQGQLTAMKAEMGSMKAKFEEMAKSPASTKVTMSADANKETFSSENLQSKQMKVMAELLKNKNK
jgi:hypothetical protein